MVRGLGSEKVLVIRWNIENIQKVLQKLEMLIFKWGQKKALVILWLIDVDKVYDP
jgi:hypothetical protein